MAEETAQPGTATRSVSYPATRREPVTDRLFGTSVADPYRWLEKDRSDSAVAAWIETQRRTTSQYLASLPMRAAFRKSLSAAYDYERLSAPQKAGGRYFHTRRSAARDQPVLYVRDGVDGADRVLVDPARWSQDGSTTFAEWQVSKDGKRVALAVQEGGSDWRIIRVADVDTGRMLDDEVKRARFTQIAWARDGSGFFYSRYPERKGERDEGAAITGHAVYFHRVGTAQSQDTLFYATPDQPGRLNAARITGDHRYAILLSSADLIHNDIRVVDFDGTDRSPRPLVTDARHRFAVIGSMGTTLYLLTDKDAERYKIVAVDLAQRRLAFRDVIPQQKAVLSDAILVGNRLLATYSVDAKSEVRRFKLDGSPDGTIALPGIGSIMAVRGDPHDREAFFVFASFNQPDTVYRYDIGEGRYAPWVRPDIRADLSTLVVRQVFYRSKDGTRIPMFVVRRRDVTGPAPTLLTAYGAFGVSMPPAYSGMLTGWVLQGGVLAIPSIRGGGEYGSAWHDAGRGARKQNSFDDFIAAAEHLRAGGIALPRGIAAYGDSAGGLLVGAVINQRPDLFAAALPSVGVMDMVRFNRFTGGRLWVGEYGDPGTAADFATLFAYSPYHNIKPGKDYPAILVTTGEDDNRVVPAHSFKYVAALQDADLGPRPRLLRVDRRAGHGAGKPTAQVIEEAADMWAFAARWTGLR